MAHVASKRVSLDEIWPDLEDGITSLVTNLNAGFPRKRWMELYSYVLPPAEPTLSPSLTLMRHLLDRALALSTICFPFSMVGWVRVLSLI